MSKKHKHEEHLNHEAWAIPYGDLVTLLLAFFVVMYAVSSLNEGKFRTMAESMSEAFGGKPRTIKPVQFGTISKDTTEGKMPPKISVAAGPVSPVRNRTWQPPKTKSSSAANNKAADGSGTSNSRGTSDNSGMSQDSGTARAGQINGRANGDLQLIGEHLVAALSDLIDSDLIEVRRTPNWLEVELKTDIFFESGSAIPNAKAVATMERLANTLTPFPNLIRVEGYTDNVPIRSLQFPSNWELSAARAASVVHVFIAKGIESSRLAIVGFSDQQPKHSNDNVLGRAANRRVLLVILALPEQPLTPILTDGLADDPAAAANLMSAASITANIETSPVPPSLSQETAVPNDEAPQSSATSSTNQQIGASEAD